MPTIYIDHQPYEVREGLSLLQAALELGFNLPYFCWHPAMGSVGACRQCAVKQFRDENDTKGRIVMACMTPAANNSYISIFDPEVIEFRASITEWLMVNHPHDCPVCDEGGECHLQDMTIMTGHNYRRYRGKKRTFNNQNLGPLVNQEMNRCIQCYRCVRFYRDYAGGHDFDAHSLHDTVFFGRAMDGALESEFSGNLVEVCPTGVFTDKTFKKHYTRKWDLQTAPSICVNCSVGCNTIPGERYGMLRRIRNRYNGDVNGYFLCDRGRYGYEFVNSQQRIREPRIAGADIPAGSSAAAPVTREAALTRIGELFAAGKRVMGIGSPRAALESNFALRELVGPDNFYQGIGANEHSLVRQIIDILQNGPARSPSLHEIATCDAVLILGEDVSNTAPMIALALKQSVRQQPVKRVSKTLHIPVWDDYPMREAIQNERGPLFIATPCATRLDEIATATYHAAPQDIARLGFAVAHELDAAAPAVDNLSDDQLALAQSIARALREADQPLILSGSSLGSAEVIQSAASAAWALVGAGRPARLSFALPECNSMGLGLMGGMNLDDALRTVQEGQVDTLVVLGNDLYRRISPEQAAALLTAARNVIVLDALGNPTTEKAQFLLPAATFAESSGALVNNEGRVQRFYQVFPASGMVQESWQWITDIMAAANPSGGAPWQSLDDLQAALTRALPVFKPLLEVAPPSSFRIAGAKIPRESARWSGRTAIFANQTVHEPPPPPDPDTPLTFSMEGAALQPPPALIPRFWAPGWNSIQALNKFQQEIAGALIGGNPGRRLIENGAVAPESNAPSASDTTSGKPYDAVPATVGPGVEKTAGQPAKPPLEQSPQQSSSPQTDSPQPNAAPPRDGDDSASARQSSTEPAPSQKSKTENQAPAGGPVDENKPDPAPVKPSHPAYFSQIPAAFAPRTGEWLVIPLYHVFGSEELSVLSPGVAELSPQPYLAMNIEDAAALMGIALASPGPGSQPEGAGSGQSFCELTLNGMTYHLPAKMSAELPRGVVGLPVGLPGLAAAGLPAFGRVTLTNEGGRGEEGRGKQ